MLMEWPAPVAFHFEDLVGELAPTCGLAENPLDFLGCPVNLDGCRLIAEVDDK